MEKNLVFLLFLIASLFLGYKYYTITKEGAKDDYKQYVWISTALGFLFIPAIIIGYNILNWFVCIFCRSFLSDNYIGLSCEKSV